MLQGHYLEAIGKAKEIACPVCHVDAGHHCVDDKGQYQAPHVERGRTARWIAIEVAS